jgi:hypothetical protein
MAFPEPIQHTAHPAGHPNWLPPEGGGLPPTLFPIRDVDAPLDVVAVVSNPRRYRSRYKLYRDFAKRMRCENIRLTTVELAFGERHYEVTEPGNPHHLQLQTTTETWSKENMINLGVARLPADWKYVCWIDADVTFARDDWAAETIHQLQHHSVVQMWSRAIDLTPTNEPHREFRSFAAAYLEELRGGEPIQPTGYVYGGKGGSYRHSGFAWAARRDAWDAMGGLIDFAILGSADFYMAWALINRLDAHLYQNVPGRDEKNFRGFHPDYVEDLMLWQQRVQSLRQDLGCVEGLILHHFHGSKAGRNYQGREKILIDNQYNPRRDIFRDWQGMYQLRPGATGLRDDIREYFKNRNEDGTEI